MNPAGPFVPRSSDRVPICGFFAATSCKGKDVLTGSEPSAELTLRCFPSGTTLGQSPLGQIQLTIRHSSQRNKLVVVVHSCR